MTDRIATIREAASQVKRYAQISMPFLLSRSMYFSESVREAALKEEGVGYLDLAGNFYLKQGETFMSKRLLPTIHLARSHRSKISLLPFLVASLVCFVSGTDKNVACQ